MQKMECSFFSEVLSKVTTITVLLPQPSLEELEKGDSSKYPVLYLLHGFSDNHRTWTGSTSLERYVEGLGLAVVMPGVDNSYYTDMKYGGRYWTFLTEELPRRVQSMFPVSGEAEDTFAAGHSMGGFGALKWGLNRPEQFKAVASMSGVTDMVFHLDKMREEDSDKSRWLQLIFGDGDVRGTENDIMDRVSKISQSGKRLPLLYQRCGEDDFLFEHNVRFLEQCKQEGVEIDSAFEPGDHNWEYWDYAIRHVLEWLPIRNQKK
ncbi:alpha/beta hydrolase family protein [Halobacillus sp. ACCC02827]|uniref:alpha/beta hydrolase n=1 Tax=Bacillaceae TaxID=186817 RepID=UPI0002A51AA9|nr:MULTISPECIES: alpha/beta hydrolase family protein [Bacillaceae]ELK47773.1 tributyrin esterase [Halobacillus sp. BAB-2008]QHT45457.1 esterase family protein [Bacillus sp. SB49]WJE16253.1 alpha/beta hydrolase family protein [Halobacillus sp. ACCC02827]